ncbi:MAG: hypothetical protein ACOCVC_02955 [Spirochaeta sp.]
MHGTKVHLTLFSTVCLLLLSVSTHTLCAGTPTRNSKHYFGFSTEWDFTADVNEPIRNFLSGTYLGTGMAYGYGYGFFRPRARLNIGYVWDAGFTPTIGIELPLYETLSPGMMKQFGAYITADIGWAFGYEHSPIYRVTPYVRFPLGPLTGIGIGASYHSESGWSVFIGRLLGGYPLKKTQ